MKKTIIILILIGAMVLFADALGLFGRAFSLGASRVFSLPVNLAGSFFNYTRLNQQLSALQLENAKLKAEILGLSERPTEKIIGRYRVLAARAYSEYPFNDKNLIFINVGAEHGVAAGMTVTVAENLLFGKVVEARAEKSVVQTVFDPNWKLPVRIGDSAAAGLFLGGSKPKITLIEKAKAVKEGDVVFSVSPEIPYGLTVANLENISETANSAYREATAKLPYSIFEVNELYVILR